MHQRNFYHCCGAVELGAFGWDAHLNPTQLTQLLAEARGRNKGYAICTTVASQTSAVRLLKSRRFKVLAVFQNPNTGNRVTLWGRGT